MRGARRDRSWRQGRAGLTALFCALLLGCPAVALADPGRPGLDSASTAVYGQSGGGGKVSQPGTNPNEDQGGSLDEQASGGAEGRVEESSPATSPGSTDSRLPFTGFSALLLLALGLGAVLSSTILRRLTRRPEHA